MKRFNLFIVLLLITTSAFSKTPLTICVNSEGRNFPSGDGSQATPFVVCNTSQFNRIGEDSLNTNNFIMGSNIDFKTHTLTPVGSQNVSFKGSFNGDEYSIKNVTLNARGYNVAIFANVENATLANLIVDNINIPMGPSSKVGGIVAYAENSLLVNLHLTSGTISAPDSSGGIAGEIKNTIVDNCSSEGLLVNTFGADGSGGLIGSAKDSTIALSHSSMTISVNTKYPFGISAIGGLIGYMVDTRIEDSYVFGDIDYSFADGRDGPREVGGLVGFMGNKSSINRAYVIGKLNINARNKGAAVGRTYSVNINESTAVFWNPDVSGTTESALGLPVVTERMSSRAFWLGEGFNDRIWDITEGRYPDLKI